MKSIFSILKDVKYIAQITSRANNKDKKNIAIVKQIINLITGNIFLKKNLIILPDFEEIYFIITNIIPDIL